MKLSYFELLSPEPVEIKNAGGILSPKLRSIAALGYNTYQYYLSILLLDAETLLSMFGGSDQYKRMTKEVQEQIHIFDLLTASEQSYSLLRKQRLCKQKRFQGKRHHYKRPVPAGLRSDMPAQLCQI